MSLADELSAAGHSLRAEVYEQALNARKEAHLAEVALIDGELEKLAELRHSSEPQAAPEAPVATPEPEVVAEVIPEPEAAVEAPVEAEAEPEPTPAPTIAEKVAESVAPEDLVADHTKDELVAAAAEQDIAVERSDTKKDIAEKLVNGAAEPEAAPDTE